MTKQPKEFSLLTSRALCSQPDLPEHANLTRQTRKNKEEIYQRACCSLT